MAMTNTKFPFVRCRQGETYAQASRRNQPKVDQYRDVRVLQDLDAVRGKSAHRRHFAAAFWGVRVVELPDDVVDWVAARVQGVRRK
jgi:hypothetical protein